MNLCLKVVLLFWVTQLKVLLYSDQHCWVIFTERNDDEKWNTFNGKSLSTFSCPNSSKLIFRWKMIFRNKNCALQHQLAICSSGIHCENDSPFIISNFKISLWLNFTDLNCFLFCLFPQIKPTHFGCNGDWSLDRNEVINWNGMADGVRSIGHSHGRF